MAPPSCHRRYSDSSDNSAFTYRSKTHLEELETWFSSLGLYRKFIARNESCIFRAVSDSRFHSQSFYLFVHRDLLGYVEKLCPNQFYQFSQQSELTKEKYIEMLKNPVYYKPSPIDLCIISRMYGYNFKLFFLPDEPPVEITSCARNQTILMFTDFESIYDLLYTEERYMTLAFCQHIVYEIYYKHVFKLEDIDYAVKKMLCRDASPTLLVPGYSDGMDAEGYVANLSIDKQVMPLSAVYTKRFDMRAKCRNMRRLLEAGITPFPFKVAKALDPDIYRNIEFDVWVEQKRGPRCGLEVWSNSRLVRGVTCIVRFPSGEGATCLIQEVYKERNEAKIYVVREKKGDMVTVPMDWLEPLKHNQVLVSQRRYLRGPWSEATEKASTLKKNDQDTEEVQCDDVSSSGDSFVTPVITPRPCGKSKPRPVLQAPRPLPAPPRARPCTPPVCYEPGPQTYFPGHVPPMYQGTVDYNYNYQEAPPPGYIHMTEPANPSYVHMAEPANTGYVHMAEPANPGYVHMAEHANPGYVHMAEPANPGYIHMTEPVNPGYVHMAEPANPGYVHMAEPANPGYVHMAEPANPGYVHMPDTMYTPVYSPELQRNTLTPLYPTEYNGLFSPPMNIASPLFFSEPPYPAMYCSEPMVPMTPEYPMPHSEPVWHPNLVPAFCLGAEMYPNPYYVPMNQMA